MVLFPPEASLSNEENRPKGGAGQGANRPWRTAGRKNTGTRQILMRLCSPAILQKETDRKLIILCNHYTIL